MNIERNGFWVISCVVVTLQRISLITSYVVWYWLFQSCFFKWSLTYKTPDGTNNQKDALVFLPSSHQTVVIKSPNSSEHSCMMDIFCSVQPSACIWLFFSLSACSDLSLSVSSYYPNLSPALTLHHYLPLIFCCPPSHYLLCLFDSPWHASLYLPPQTLPCFPQY